ncbi:multicopper oxidase domain-containing protein [Kribbella sp. NPDC051137]|uniref:multicopper oxidase domain-containing protein n=1 Tax=Kribbella sp. NPDC051137 TaxID=3155045 RepID=UPI002F81D64E
MRPSRGFWPLRDVPVVFWLLSAVVVAVARPVVPAPRWLLIHLLLLGAVSHSILVWSRHFADALLRTPIQPTDRREQSLRLLMLNVGVLCVLVGVSAGHWLLTMSGAVALVVAVGWHGAGLVMQLRIALPGRFRVTVRYYIAAAGLLPVGATIGVVLARVQADPWHARLLVAHASINLLGWIGLTALGTLVTLWPTMLRTRIAPGAERAARRALPVLLAGITLAAGGALADVRLLAALGFVVYLVGLGLLAKSFVGAARARPPAAFTTYSVGAAMIWLVGCLVALVIDVARTWSITWFTPLLAVGFGAQLLFGSMSYLIPVALGGGPGPVRAAGEVLDRAGVLRVVAANGALAMCALPVPAPVRELCAVVVLVAFASILPLLVLAIRASVGVKRGVPRPEPRMRLRPRQLGVIGLAVVTVAVLGGAVIDRAVSSADKPTGRTTVARVATYDMRFHPDTISVPAGDRLVIELSNTDSDEVHDLVLDDGHDSGRLRPGTSTRMDVGVITRDLQGWCAVVGHRQMGMTLSIHTAGVAIGPRHDSVDLSKSPGTGFTAYDPRLPALAPSRVYRRTLHIREVRREVAPGVAQKLWTYDGTMPGPTLHGRIGDRFEITVVNDTGMGHSIDFHAGSRAPGQVMRTIPPGGRLVYRFTATRAGIWMYHCSTMPMSTHIANGLFGAVVIDPPGLAPVGKSYVLLQSELYLGANGGEVDTGKLMAERPDLVVFNGYADQYDHQPLQARAGERIRVWVLDAGPDRPTAFHVVGGQFSTTYAEGTWLLRGGTGGSQTLALGPSQGGFVELTFPEPGRYPFVSHVMIDAERGAHGTFTVGQGRG